MRMCRMEKDTEFVHVLSHRIHDDATVTARRRHIADRAADVRRIHRLQSK